MSLIRPCDTQQARWRVSSSGASAAVATRHSRSARPCTVAAEAKRSGRRAAVRSSRCWWRHCAIAAWLPDNRMGGTSRVVPWSSHTEGLV